MNWRAKPLGKTNMSTLNSCSLIETVSWVTKEILLIGSNHQIILKKIKWWQAKYRPKHYWWMMVVLRTRLVELLWSSKGSRTGFKKLLNFKIWLTYNCSGKPSKIMQIIRITNLIKIIIRILSSTSVICLKSKLRIISRIWMSIQWWTCLRENLKYRINL